MAAVPAHVRTYACQVLTVKYPSEIRWDEKKSSLSSCVGNGDGCDADVTVCATNRLAGPSDDARVNFTFEVRKAQHDCTGEGRGKVRARW